MNPNTITSNRNNSLPLMDIGILIIRVVFGSTMLFGHGVAKWSRLWGTEEIRFADPFGLGPAASLGMAVIAEVIASILVIVGLQTRLALFPLIITMAVALFVVHGGDDFATQEKAILYGITFIGLFLTGPGKFSIDAYFSHKNS